MITAGVDPGKKGHVAVVDTTTRQVLKTWRQPLIGDGKGDTFDRTAMDAIAGELRLMGVRAVGLELTLPAGRTRASTLVLFRQGQSYGLWQGILTANKLPVIEALPTAWRKALGVQQPKIARAWKGAAPSPEAEEADEERRGQQRKLGMLEVIRKVQSLFPGVDLRLTPDCRSPSEDMAVSILLAMFAAGERVDGAVARRITPEEAAAELEAERRRKAEEEQQRREVREAKERERREAREKRDAERAERKRVAEKEKWRKAQLRAEAKAERDRIKAERETAKAARKAEREAKRLAVEGR